MASPSGSLLAGHVNSSRQQKVVAGYVLQQRLGSGSFATVYKGVKLPAPTSNSNDKQQQQQQQPQNPDAITSSSNNSTIEAGGTTTTTTTTIPDTVAIKAITRSSEKLTKKVLENLDIEISILRTYRHPHIVCLHDVQKTERHFYLILEYCGGGDVQRLIRTRKAGRLSEGLTRRLVRDLALGLGFLWGQELIHRDIKPQNLLLTGPLPLDELNDPEKTVELEERRREVNFPSPAFALKIADFGFARHLQSASLAETLCGSPLYMAPEILQHHRYDAKADLWSVGTVLFEMISGRPPFHGENHIDLLRNIQRKAVRLPPDVRVSSECVNLLRLLLNRNPLSRAGFKEFFDACQAFVALGCQGTAREEIKSWEKRTMMDLGTIQENDVEPSPGTDSMLTVATAAHQPQQQQQQHRPLSTALGTPTIVNPVSSAQNPTAPGFVTPPFGPVVSPALLVSNAQETAISVRPNDATRMYSGLQPLQSSPTPPQTVASTGPMPSLPNLDNRGVMNYPPIDTTHRIDSSQNSTDESGFVIVDLSSGHPSSVQSPAASGTELHEFNRKREGPATLQPSPPSSPKYQVTTNPVVTSRGDYMVVNDLVNRRAPKGLLSTSPGTGGALMGLMGGRARSLYEAVGGGVSAGRMEAQIESMTKLLAASEDVGRRAVSVAHLGDARAYMALRFMALNEEAALLGSSSPMEGVEEEPEHSSGEVTDDTGSTEVMGPARRRSSSATIMDAKVLEDEEEMPFAVSPESPSTKAFAGMPSRTCHSSIYGKGVSMASSKALVRAGPTVIRSHFGEALSCYLKSLSMLKGALGGVQNLMKDLDALATQRSLSSLQREQVQKLVERKKVTQSWLSGQFKGVLERADAANLELSKYTSTQQQQQQQQTTPATATAPETEQPTEALRVRSVEELIYNHALACGRDGAVKQLLGQFDAARTCYRTAGLLAETLLMQSSIGSEDRKILEGYVDGFAARITELDEMMLIQSRSMIGTGGGGGSSSNSSSIERSRRGSGVIGLIGPPQQPYQQHPATFGLGVLRMGSM